MDKDRKENRRINYNKKHFSKNKDKDFILEKKDTHKVVRDYKNKKKEIAQDELWEEWSDEIS